METYVMNEGSNQELSLKFHSVVQKSVQELVVTFYLADGDEGPQVAPLSISVDATGGTLEACVDIAEAKLMKKFGRMVGEYDAGRGRNQYVPRGHRN